MGYYAFIEDVPATVEVYREVCAALGDATPDGLISHVVLRRDGGLRYLDVWQSREAWERFRDERVEPAVRAALAARGIPHDHALAHFEEVDAVDAWVGAADRTALAAG
jgi:hypothetical protein